MTSTAPLQVHGLDLSYFTGKLEAYLRNKGIAYDLIEMDTRDFKRCAKATGVAQMPQVEWSGGQWLSDTKRIIPFLEQHYTKTSIACGNQASNFV
ncbi:MAG: glutathione S-transferase N-terminal domain-containing protein, partial [Limnobacter sp.]|nr:glutathione S-transferase N-terminal domain-containing protein [Limnobacter sp.]